MTRHVLTPNNDRYTIRNPHLDNVRGGDGNDAITCSVTALAERMVINGEAGNDRIVITKAAVRGSDLTLLSVYGDNYTGDQGSDTFVFRTGGNERVRIEANGRGGHDDYVFEGSDYARAVELKNFNPAKDQMSMDGSVEVTALRAEQVGRAWAVYELTLETDTGQMAHLERRPSAVRAAEMAEDGDNGGVLFRMSARHDDIADVLEGRLNNGTLGNGVHGDWFNPEGWM